MFHFVLRQSIVDFRLDSIFDLSSNVWCVCVSLKATINNRSTVRALQCKTNKSSIAVQMKTESEWSWSSFCFGVQSLTFYSSPPGLPHPPLFACVLQKVNSSHRLECHLFVCHSAENAMEMCSLIEEYKHRAMGLATKVHRPLSSQLVGPYSYGSSVQSSSMSVVSNKSHFSAFTTSDKYGLHTPTSVHYHHPMRTGTIARGKPSSLSDCSKSTKSNSRYASIKCL